MTGAKQIKDDPELLAAMLDGARDQHELWQPGNYWKTYCRRIERALADSGLQDFRINQELLKGFGMGGEPRPALPRASWKRVLWRLAETLPPSSHTVAGYRHLLRAEHQRAVADSMRVAKLLFQAIAGEFPDLRPPLGLTNGGAEDVFTWRGRPACAEWAVHVVRAAAFYRRVPPKSVTSYVEVGPGLGLSTLAHMALNPHLKLVVNIDIPPILYISTQFLKSIPGLQVRDMRALEGGDGISASPAGRGTKVYQLAPWQLPRLDGKFAAFFNYYSFQEMEPEICANYARTVIPLIGSHIMLLSSHGGHEKGAGGQREQVTLPFLRGLFAKDFPRKTDLSDPALELYQEPRNGVLLSRR